MNLKQTCQPSKIHFSPGEKGLLSTPFWSHLIHFPIRLIQKELLLLPSRASPSMVVFIRPPSSDSADASLLFCHSNHHPGVTAPVRCLSRVPNMNTLRTLPRPKRSFLHRPNLGNLSQQGTSLSVLPASPDGSKADGQRAASHTAGARLLALEQPRLPPCEVGLPVTNYSLLTNTEQSGARGAPDRLFVPSAAAGTV